MDTRSFGLPPNLVQNMKTVFGLQIIIIAFLLGFISQRRISLNTAALFGALVFIFSCKPF